MLLLADLDGVVYRGREPVPGVPELLRRRVAAGDTIVYCTNNSRAHRSEFLERLGSLGAPVSEDQVVTSARAAALALTDGTAGPRPERVLVLGGPGLARELREVGLRVVSPTLRGVATRPDAVVVGIDFRLSHRRLSMAARAVRAGARFIATNRDPVFPAPDGLLAGAGAIVAGVTVAAGREPDLVIGKPEPLLFRMAAESVGAAPEEAVVLGDSLLTDLPAARAIGARSVLLLTGVTTREELELVPEDARPTAVAEDADELDDVLDRLARA